MAEKATNSLVALDVKTGKQLWSEGLGTIAKASPVLADHDYEPKNPFDTESASYRGVRSEHLSVLATYETCSGACPGVARTSSSTSPRISRSPGLTAR